tara:strand:- start:119 stop:451 length:333 start_codon:yes stop_codon:yes gene_type:complete
MTSGNLIAKRIETNDFLELIKPYSKEQIECTDHTSFRLSEKQRKVLTCEKLKEYLLHEIPFLVGIQNNKNYAVFYNEKKNKFMRMIIDIQIAKINIVTFYFIEQWQIPKI